MKSRENREDVDSGRLVFVLAGLGVVSWVIYLVIAWLSRRCALDVPGVERPILEILGLLAAAFVCYLLALRIAVRAENQNRLLPAIVIFAVSFRATLLFSEPIQEIDIYRYLWDGQAIAVGVNPFRYSPEQVLTRDAEEPLPKDLAKLVTARDSSPAVTAILEEVHFGELTTVYPPVSQAVFALATFTTPSAASVSNRLVIMKAWIVLFDLATIWILILLLRLLGKPVSWSLAYSWCPLVLKEFANSGHLDSIAVFLTVSAVYLALRGCFFSSSRHAGIPHAVESDRARYTKGIEVSARRWLLAAIAVLALAFGAKLYPVVLTPLFFFTAVRRFGWKTAVASAGLFLAVSAFAFLPMVERGDSKAPAEPAAIADSSPPLPPGGEEPDFAKIDQQTPGDGLREFLSRWEMNDFLFLLLVENLKPDDDLPLERRTWFVIVPNEWRRGILTMVSPRDTLTPKQASFLVARVITGCVFFVVAIWLAVRSARSMQPQQPGCFEQPGCFPRESMQPCRFAETTFLTLAWFWLLLPTQNPWYWIWAIPFLPFARSQAWRLLSGLSLLYYLRFWFDYHRSDTPIMGTNYPGTLFFDFVVTWLEFAPWFLLLAAEYVVYRRMRRGDDGIVSG